MEFEQFQTDRLVELQRFATVLAGEPERADALVARAARVARAQWQAVEAAGRPFAVLRAGIARSYLHDADAVPVDAPAAEFGALSRTQRSVLVLICYAGQSDAETAHALDIEVAEVRNAHLGGIEALGSAEVDARDGQLADDLFGRDGSLGEEQVQAADRWLRDVLDEYGEELSPEPAALELAIAAELSDAEGSPTAFADLFGSPGSAAGRAADGADAADGAAAQGVSGDTVGDEHVTTAAALAQASSVEADPSVPAARKPSVAAAIDTLTAVADGRTWTPQWRWIALAASVIVAIGIAVLVGRRTDYSTAERPVPVSTSTSTATERPPAGSLSGPINRTLPGGRILGEFFGSGPRTISSAIYTVGAGRELIVNAVCSGSGRAQLGPVTLARCDGTPLAAAVTSRATRSVVVQAPASVTWRLVVVDSPPRDTTAALRYPADPALRASSATERVAFASGTGSGTVALASGTPQQRGADIRVLLTCVGGPLSVSTSDGSLTAGRVSTCYEGWSYEFDTTSTLLSGTLRLTATTSTSWRLLVVRE